MGMVEYIDMKLWKEYEVKHEKWVLYYTYSETQKSLVGIFLWYILI